MKVIQQPNKSEWSALVKRPSLNQKHLAGTVGDIIERVKIEGDNALRAYAKQFDGVELNKLQASNTEIMAAAEQVSDDLKAAIQVAYNNITTFHKAQQIQENVVVTSPGVKCWRKSVAIEKVGLYIPSGSAPLFSTILMLGIPAQLAGCKEIILCTPPNKAGKINPAILYTANLAGITKLFKVGGAQAIAAMAYGTATIPQTYKIFGPGNQYVTKAKEMVQQSGVAIDMPAGPSEVLVIVDETCNPAFVAADLLSQAEHGTDSQVILLSDSKNVIDSCMAQVDEQVVQLPRKDTALKALENSTAIVCSSLNECFELSNYYAPEHLIIASQRASDYTDKVANAGSVFLGNFSCESAGDYASGTNHTLPTNGYAKNYSGVSLDSFVKKITFQELNEEGMKNIGPSIELMAEAEELMAHKNAVSIRLKEINND